MYSGNQTLFLAWVLLQRSHLQRLALSSGFLVICTFVQPNWAGLLWSSFWFLAAGCWKKQARLQKPKKACKGSIRPRTGNFLCLLAFLLTWNLYYFFLRYELYSLSKNLEVSQLVLSSETQAGGAGAEFSSLRTHALVFVSVASTWLLEQNARGTSDSHNSLLQWEARPTDRDQHKMVLA